MINEHLQQGQNTVATDNQKKANEGNQGRLGIVSNEIPPGDCWANLDALRATTVGGGDGVDGVGASGQ